MVFKDMLKLYNIRMTQRLMDLDFSDQLSQLSITFCLALDLFRELLAMILAAEILLV